MTDTTRLAKKNRHTIAILLASIVTVSLIPIAQSQLMFRNTITGEVLDFSFGKKGEKTEAVKHFKNTGENIYNNDEEAIHTGESLFMTACSGCHGHHAEGKLGPALGDDYYTYPKNATDKGLFETIYGGARSMMGPQYNNLTIDEMLQVMAWIRSVYWGDPEKAEWLSEEERADFTPAPVPEDYKEALKNFKK
ncbi:cytochrome c(L), periplasmic [Methylophaga sp.]|jgi:cytochrome c-L|uniref:cytochrome c(L), periplasmic n=1 Tax=Methylophaga sp. TaxID=2024840 RepID=UPI0013FFF8B0|nr:cytochrome c(L), periplasmic [Methylophaga sp.]MTI63562.1 cytochrome c(L), periplasmic [Methylophaga sp.]